MSFEAGFHFVLCVFYSKLTFPGCVHICITEEICIYTQMRDIKYMKSFNIYGIVFLKTVCEQDPIAK